MGIGESGMEKYHDLKDVTVNDDTLSFWLEGKEYSFSLSKVSKRLANASKFERELFHVSPSGYGIHWSAVDEDLSIDGLLGISHSPHTQREEVSVS
jgi:hypothetical protein